ncbi:MAG: SHOCT domain-containing protein [Chloroflexota bacterium]
MLRGPMRGPGPMRRGPSLIGVAATTAVVAGTAGAVQHKQEQKYANQAAQQQAAADQQAMAAQLDAQQQQIAAMQQAQAAAPAPAPAAAAPAATPAPTGLTMDEKVAQLNQLAELHKAGILTDDEFAAQKAKILAS